MALQIEKLFIYTPHQSHSIAKVFHSQPDENLVDFFGHLFGIIEANVENKKIFDILDTLTKTLEDIYYDFTKVNQKNFDISHHFEQSLKQLNIHIHRLLSKENLEKNIDLFNFSIAVVKNNTLHFSAIHDIYGFLIYKGKSDKYKIADIIGNYQGTQKESKTDPYNVFNYTVSGEFPLKTYLILCNKKLLEHIPIDEQRELITTNTLKSAMEEMRNQLWQASRSQTFACVAVHNQAEVSLNPVVSSRDRSQSSLNQLLNTEDTTEKLLSASLSLNIAPYQKWIKEIFFRAFASIKKIRPRRALASATQHAKKFSSVLSASAPAIKNLLKHKPRMREFFLQQTRRTVTAVKNARMPRPSFPKHGKNFAVKTYQTLSRAGKNILQRSAEYWTTFSKRQKIASISLMVFIVLFSATILNKHEEQKTIVSEEIYASQKTAVEENIANASAALIYNDTDKASSEIQAAFEKLLLLPSDTEARSKETIELTQKAQSIMNTAQKIIEVDDFETVAELLPNTSPMAFEMASGYVFIAQENGSVLKFQGKEASKAETIMENFGKVIASEKLSDTDVLFITNEGKTVTLSSKNALRREGAILLSNEETGAMIDAVYYNSKIYSLTPGKIFRHNAASPGFGSATPWLNTSEPALVNAKTLSVDGSVYVASADGAISKWNSGKKQTYQTAFIQPSISDPARLWTSATSDKLYLSENSQKRVVVFDKASGKLLNQYFLSVTSLRDFSVDEASKTITILTDTGLLRFSLR